MMLNKANLNVVCLQKKKSFHNNTSPYIKNIVKHKRKPEVLTSPLPYNPFQKNNLQNSKLESSSKNIKKMAISSVNSDNESNFSFLKDCELKTDKLISQPLSPTVISSETLNFNNLAGFNKVNNTLELSAIVSPLGKSPNAKFSNEQLLISRRKLSYDLTPMSELFKSPSHGVVVSTPKSTNKHHEINSEKLMTYITTTLPEINVKRNKVLLNQSKIEKMLIDLKNAHPVLNDSNIEDNNILEYFPITTMEKLDTFNQELKNDRELLKRFKHTITPYGVTSVLQAVRAILDLILTNKLGQKISLTGRGANNIQDKKAFKSLYLYKIMSSLLIQNIKDATILDINKAITGWLKHADHETTIDNVITNVDIAALVYESLISDHRPILVMDIDTFKEIEKYSETVDDQIVQKEVKNNFIKPNVPAIDGFPVEKFKKSIKSTKVLNNNNLDDIEFIQVNSNTLKVPENCSIRSDSLLETISDNATVSKNPKTIKISSIKNKVDITSSSTFCGFTNIDGVSCYANSIIQVLFNCQSLVNEIRNNQLGPTLQHSLHEYTSNSGSCVTRTIREYLDNETILYTVQQQQDCIEFLEALMDRSRPTFESLFGFKELYTIRCNTCKHTTANNAPTSLILHFEILQHRSQTLQTLLSTNQNVWNTLDDYKCNNCNNIGSSEDKHQIIVANEYIITDLKLSGVPTSILEIAGAQYKTQAAILHMGENTSSGHYIAYLRQGTSNWVCANDTIVAEKRWPNNSKDLPVPSLDKKCEGANLLYNKAYLPVKNSKYVINLRIEIHIH
ncbi:ubiquitin carboxyl-terminal hydrolase 25-like [Aphis craccivora]|uniref:Ubiquitin carboxyl-terminal hydrolase 25-like n=1 Tax=Aphis craccivora TaxID=307492 RepID=A0A6G0Y806_APHCR|nr:ubiquitin carboxyl-terminal hydrolase 25-like [Aphis craccivora]